MDASPTHNSYQTSSGTEVSCIHCNNPFVLSPYKIKKHYRVCDDCIKVNRKIRNIPTVQGNYQPIAVAQTIPTSAPAAIQTSDPLVETTEVETHERKIATQPEVVCDEGFDSKYVPQNGEVEKLEFAISCGLNVLLTGPTGCGKTHLVMAVAKKLGKPVYTVPSGGATYERIIAKDALESENGVTVTRRPSTKFPQTWSMLPLAMNDADGAILYCDEPNTIPDEVLFSLFSAMDDRRELAFDDGTTLNAHKGFTVIGAMNEGAGYGGTSILNNAFRSRTHRIIDMEYLPQAREAKMLVARTGVDKDIADKLTKCAKALRASLAGKTLKTPIGTRDLLACCKLVVAGDNVHSAIEDTIINRAPSTSPERQSISDVVAAHFGKGAK